MTKKYTKACGKPFLYYCWMHEWDCTSCLYNPRFAVKTEIRKADSGAKIDLKARSRAYEEFRRRRLDKIGKKKPDRQNNVRTG